MVLENAVYVYSKLSFYSKHFWRAHFSLPSLADKRICLQSVSLTIYKTPSREFPGSGVVGIPCFHCKVREIRSHKSCGMAKKKKESQIKSQVFEVIAKEKHLSKNSHSKASWLLRQKSDCIKTLEKHNSIFL